MSDFDGVTHYLNFKKYLVKYIPKSKLPNKGMYGYCSDEYKLIYILETLPNYVKKFVLSHEIQHSLDLENGFKSGWWMEIRANLFSGLKHPVGFIGCIIMTIFSVERWKYYIRRVIE